MMAPRHFEMTNPRTHQRRRKRNRQNALVHGLSGRTGACLPAKKAPSSSYYGNSSQPSRPSASLNSPFAEDIAGDRWRLTRARAMENALFSRIAQEQPDPLDPAAALAAPSLARRLAKA